MYKISAYVFVAYRQLPNQTSIAIAKFTVRTCCIRYAKVLLSKYMDESFTSDFFKGCDVLLVQVREYLPGTWIKALHEVKYLELARKWKTK